MNWLELENEFQVGVDTLLADMKRQLAPDTREPYHGAGRQPPHEHDTRIYFFDRLLELLGWRLGIQGDITEEARLKVGTTTFMDYVGVRSDTNVPVLVLEAKSWDKPLVAPRGGGRPNATAKQLIVEAIEHIRRNGTKNTAPVTGEWHDNLQQVAGYVRDLKERHGHRIPRIVLGTGQWLLVFTSPATTFVEGSVDEEDFRIFLSSNYVEQARDIHRLLSRPRLANVVPDYIRPSQLRDYVEKDGVVATYRATLVKYESSGSRAFEPIPRILVYPALLIQRDDGALLTVLNQVHPLTMNVSPSTDALDDHFGEIADALATVLEACSQELGSELLIYDLERFPGFPERDAKDALGPVNPRKNVVRSFGNGDEWIFALGSPAHHLCSDPTINCKFHVWAECRAAGHPIGTTAISIPSASSPRAFFVDGSKYHCAHQQLQDRRKRRCFISAFDSRTCCRACVYQNVCWTDEELRKLPCGK
jgi:hypothetical protein